MDTARSPKALVGKLLVNEKAGRVAARPSLVIASEECFIPVSDSGATTRIIGNAKGQWGEAQLCEVQSQKRRGWPSLYKPELQQPSQTVWRLVSIVTWPVTVSGYGFSKLLCHLSLEPA